MIGKFTIELNKGIDPQDEAKIEIVLNAAMTGVFIELENLQNEANLKGIANMEFEVKND